MAEEDERELTEEEQAELERKKKRKQRLLLALLGVGLIVVSVGSTLVLLRFLGDPDPKPGEQAEAEAEAQQEAAPEPAQQEAIYYPLTEKLVIDYNVRGRQRFLQVGVSLMFRDNEVNKAIERHLPHIRNDLNLLLKGQEFEQLQTPEGKELVRQDALRRVNAILEEETGEAGVEQVLFTSFVMQ